jgi:ABC-2 type transport system permease protein
MAGVVVLVRKELLEQWRTMRLPLVSIVFVLIGLGSPLLARFTPEIIRAVAGDQLPIVLPRPTAADAIDQLAKNLNQFGALIAILLAMGSVASEKERGTAALLLAKPVGRAGFLLAKLVAIGATLGLATLLAVLAAWFYTLVLFAPLPPAGMAASAVLDWLLLMSWAAITFLGSTLSRSSVAAAGLGIAGLIVIGVLSAFPPIAPWLPTGVVGPARAFALGISGPALLPALVGSITVILGSVGLAWLSFRRQEL